MVPGSWTEADKDGYGPATTTASKVWYTLDDGRLTEVFYPDLGTPSVRALEFVVTDGGFSQRDTEASNRTVQQVDSRSLTYRQVKRGARALPDHEDVRDRSVAQRPARRREVGVAKREG
jgi:hypothetical protein